MSLIIFSESGLMVSIGFLMVSLGVLKSLFFFLKL